MLRKLIAFTAYFVSALFAYTVLYILLSIVFKVEIDAIWYIVGTIYPIAFALLWFLLIILPTELLLFKYYKYLSIITIQINITPFNINRFIKLDNIYIKAFIFSFICSLINIITIIIINILMLAFLGWVQYLFPLFLDQVAFIWILSFAIGVYLYYLIKYYARPK